MFIKIKNLNYLLIFLTILITFIGAAGLYSAAGGSYNPWASRHLMRLILLMFLSTQTTWCPISAKQVPLTNPT